jgi:hypothetical protein
MSTIPHNTPALNAATQNAIVGNMAKTTERAAINSKISQTTGGDFDTDVQITDQGRRSAYVQTEKDTAAFSQIRDANIADEIINLAKSQVLNQSGVGALGKINQDAQALLGLLK